MKAVDASRGCQYIISRNPLNKCREPLVGRGRYKWCAKHQPLVREEQRKAGNPRWQRAWRQRHGQSILFGIATPKSANRICGLLKKKYNIVVTNSLRAKMLECLRAVFVPNFKANQFAMVYSFLPPGYNIFSYLAPNLADKRSRPPVTGKPQDTDWDPGYYACVFCPSRSEISDPDSTRFRDHKGILNQLLHNLLIWSRAMGWGGDTAALVVPIGPVIAPASEELGICYLKFFEKRRCRHEIFWFGDPKVCNVKEPSNRLNRLLLHGFAETGGDKQAWTKSVVEAMYQVNLDNSVVEENEKQ